MESTFNQYFFKNPHKNNPEITSSSLLVPPSPQQPCGGVVRAPDLVAATTCDGTGGGVITPLTFNSGWPPINKPYLETNILINENTTKQ